MNAKRDRRLTPCAGIWACCLACIVSISGCYKYVPVTNPEPGRPVRAYLTATGGESVVPRFGPGVTELTGTVLARDGDDFSQFSDCRAARRAKDFLRFRALANLPDQRVFAPAATDDKDFHLSRATYHAAPLIGKANLALLIPSEAEPSRGISFDSAALRSG